ncbi:MAG: SGNH/GDSL hydrolase family protein [Microcoleaceae cyanobacterium MO_207.B10]|nr:SGNH/GDSL hydrolase family protein [Microcoleaceae cyanobacterium MO_207.B10]
MSINYKKIQTFILLTFSWIIVPLFLVEILMIVLEPYLFKGLYQYDPDLGFRVRPYINGNNQFGFNDRDYPLEKDPNKFRLLIVSDSFNWAGGKDGNYTALLEKKFESYYRTQQVDVINVGYPGTHTGEQLPMLKKYGLQYNPDLVVLGFFAGNDFRDADPERKRIIVNGIYLDIDKEDELIIFGYPIIGKSRLLMFLQQKYQVYQELQKAKQDSAQVFSNYLLASLNLASAPIIEQEKSPGILSKEAFLRVEKSRLKFCKIRDLLEGKRDDNINYIFHSISEMQQLLKSRNIRFIVAIYPDEYQVNDELLNEIFAEYDDLKRESYNITCQQEILKKYLQANGIPYIDMLDEFRIEQNNRPLYLLREPHWNSSGNQLAADILFNYLVKDTDNFFRDN